MKSTLTLLLALVPCAAFWASASAQAPMLAELNSAMGICREHRNPPKQHIDASGIRRVDAPSDEDGFVPDWAARCERIKAAYEAAQKQHAIEGASKVDDLLQRLPK